MKNIIKSLAVIVAVAAVAGGATYAWFTSTATITGNTFSAGVLEIKVDGAASITGFTMSSAIPGDCAYKSFRISNPTGSGAVDASQLVMNVINKTGALCPALNIRVDDETFSLPNAIYNDKLNSIPADLDLLKFSTPTLPVNHYLDFKASVCFTKENTDQAEYQGTSCQFDIAVQAYTGK